MRKKIVAGNWKMNMNWSEAKEFIMNLNSWTTVHKPQADVIVATPSLYLQELEKLTHHPRLYVAAQDVSAHDKGAFTGEISASQLKSIDITHAIVGHSERREYHHEKNELLAKKLKSLFDHGIRPIYCVGETLNQRKLGQQKKIVREQLQDALLPQDRENLSKMIIAYEPVWAIGTGETATPEQAQEMHAEIRKVLHERFGEETAESMPILYGGSVKPGNARELFKQSDIDGGLVGGASLNIEDFRMIINAAIA